MGQFFPGRSGRLITPLLRSFFLPSLSDGGIVEQPNLPFSEITPLAGTQISQFERPDGGAAEFANGMTKGEHHSSDLPVAAFGQHDSHGRAVPLCPRDADRVEAGGTGLACSLIGQVDATLKSSDGALVNLPLDADLVDTPHMMFRMTE